MIIGLDETGDFSKGTRAIFVAAFIQPSAYDRVCSALAAWESTTRRRLGIKNEVKGNRIDTVAADQFLADVVGNDDQPTLVGYTAFAVDVNEQSLEVMDVQRTRFVDGYRAWADVVRQDGLPDSARFANKLDGMAHWISARSQGQLLRIVTLTAILPRLVEYAFGISIARGWDEELVELRITTDNGYTKKSEEAEWNDLLRNAFVNVTAASPIPFSDEWAPNHPVIVAFVDEGDGQYFRLAPTFKDRFAFGDSATTPEIRIADVMAAIIGRSESSGEFVPIHERLRQARLHEERYTVLQWTNESRAAPRNPYLDFPSSRPSAD